MSDFRQIVDADKRSEVNDYFGAVDEWIQRQDIAQKYLGPNLLGIGRKYKMDKLHSIKFHETDLPLRFLKLRQISSDEINARNEYLFDAL